MPEANPTRERFDRRAFALIQEGAHRAALEVPELEAVAVVCLWRFPDQAGLPSATLIGADGPVVNPDQLLRLQIATNRLQVYLAENASAGIQALRDLASNLARASHAEAERRRREATQGPGPGPGGPADGAAGPDRAGLDRPAEPPLGPA